MNLNERKAAAMQKLHNGQVGQGLVEYALILVLIAVVVIVILALVGGGLFAPRQPNMPQDVCPGTVPTVVRQSAGYGKDNVIVDYINVQGDTVHLLFGQDESNAPFNMYSRTVESGNDCKQ